MAFRCHTLLLLDDRLYALQPSLPHVTWPALRRCLQRNGISMMPDVEGDRHKRQKVTRYPIEFVHVDIAEVQTAEGKFYLYVGVDEAVTFDGALLVATADRKTTWDFEQQMLESVPDKVMEVSLPNNLRTGI